MGKKGDVNGDVYKVTFSRSDLHVKAGKVLIKPALALINWAAFKKAGDAAITYGDFVLLDDEINPVIKALRANGIEIASLHNHMLNEEPRLFFMHVWAYDDAATLAKGLKAALDRTRR